MFKDLGALLLFIIICGGGFALGFNPLPTWLAATLVAAVMWLWGR